MNKLLKLLLIGALPMYMAEEDGDPGAPAPAPAPSPSPAPAAPAPAPAAEGDPSLLSQGNAPAPAPAPAAAEGEHWAPEKYQVKNADGSIDHEATGKKQAEAFAALESRMGTDGVRPKEAAEYTFDVPENLKDQWNPEEDDQYNEFKDKAHEHGLTQKQFEFAVNTYLEAVADIKTGDAIGNQEDTQAALAKLWPNQKDYQMSLNASFRAASAYANEGGADTPGSMMNLERKFGDDPDFIAFAANIGREIREDIPAQGAILEQENVEELQKSEAYWDENHPQHQAVKTKVSNHYSRKFNSKR